MQDVRVIFGGSKFNHFPFAEDVRLPENSGIMQTVPGFGRGDKTGRRLG